MSLTSSLRLSWSVVVILLLLRITVKHRMSRTLPSVACIASAGGMSHIGSSTSTDNEHNFSERPWLFTSSPHFLHHLGWSWIAFSSLLLRRSLAMHDIPSHPCFPWPLHGFILLPPRPRFPIPPFLPVCSTWHCILHVGYNLPRKNAPSLLFP